jgi:transposase
MLTYHAAYADLGGDYYVRRDPVRARYRAIRQLESLGYQVTVQSAGA